MFPQGSIDDGIADAESVRELSHCTLGQLVRQPVSVCELGGDLLLELRVPAAHAGVPPRLEPVADQRATDEHGSDAELEGDLPCRMSEVLRLQPSAIVEHGAGRFDD